VVLVSGGADSAVGALVSRSQLGNDEGHLLLSHVGSKTLATFQDEVASTVERLLPGPSQEHLAIGLRRRAAQIDGTSFTSEASSRSRSLLFLSLGLAAESIHDVPLWIPENGFASLNPPLSPDRRGSLSTRTTHPRFLEDLSGILQRIGAQAEIHNPFADLTKGEMFITASELVGADEASAFLSATHSCAHSDQRFIGFGVDRQCGVCFGCIVRRASFKAAGLNDATKYVSGGSARVDRWLAGKSVELAMRGFVQRGARGVDIAAMSLPASYSPKDALDLCQRGCAELEGYLK
jgi:7-cyano-7-deazaguanine synthase in queuosine biosynthesis